jgi:NADH-quinone oxidoreductase subunit M
MKDLNAREVAYFMPLVVVAFWIGLYPKPFMDILQKPVERLVTQVNPDFYKAQSLTAGQQAAARSGMAAMAAPGGAEGTTKEGGE